MLRPNELADAFQMISEGGILEGEGRIEIFNCLRREDELSFAGGVFVIVECDDLETWSILQKKGHVVARNGLTAMLYNPQHLLGVETTLSILFADLLKVPTGGENPRPLFDLVARTNRDFAKDEVLRITDPHHHEVFGLGPELVPANPIGRGRPIPYYLASEGRLIQDVPQGVLIQSEMIKLELKDTLQELRFQLDKNFNLK